MKKEINIAYWNTYKKALHNELHQLCQLHSIDVLILVENEGDDKELIKILNNLLDILKK